MCFGKLISGGEYSRALGKRFGVFVAVTLAFPLLVLGMIEVSGARNVGGAAGALALVAGFYLKPIIYLWFAYSTMRISLRRARTIGMSPMIGFCIPLLILADLSFGIVFGSFWAVGFSLGIVAQSLPASLLSAVIAVVTLILLREIEDPMSKRMATAYGVWKALLFISLGLGLVAILPMLSIWFLGPRGMGLSMTLVKATSHLRAFLIYPFGLLLAFATASAFLIVESRRPNTGGRNSAAGPTRAQAPMFGARKT